MEKNEIEPEKEGLVHFGNHQAYRQDKALPKFALWASLGIAAIAIIPVFFVSPPEVQSLIDSPSSSNLQTPSLEVAEYAPNSKITDSGSVRRQGTPKKAFLGLQSFNRPRAARIPPGSYVKAVLVTGASNGAVKAVIKESVKIRGETLLPVSTQLIGSGQSTEDRLYIRFDQAVFPDGTFEGIQAEAVDSSDQIAGLKGSKVGFYATRLGAAVGLNFVGGMAQGLQQKEAVGQEAVVKASPKNALLNGASFASLELANETMSGLKSQRPMIEVEVGSEIFVMFSSQ